MNVELQSLLDDCKTYSNPKRVKERISNFPPELREIVEDENGAEVLETGVALFAYLADVIIAKGEIGIKEAWNIVKLGYPQQKFTDLMTQFFDVYRTRLLWMNAIDHLQTTPIIKVEIVLNVYFRWYVSTIEFMRKILVFAEYCRRCKENQHEDFNYPKYLYGTGDPQKVLEKSSAGGRGEIACQFYDKSLRHALAHGNVVLALPHIIAVRQTTEQPATEFIRNTYRVGINSTQDDTNLIIKDFQKFAEPCYQSVRVFLTIYQCIESKHIRIFKKHWPSDVNDEVLKAVVEIIQGDPDGLLHWRPNLDTKFSKN